MKILIIALLLSAIQTKAQNYEIWGTLKLTGKISDKFDVSIEGEDRYNFDKQHIRYFHYDIGVSCKLNDNFYIGAFYREIYVNKGNFINRVTVPHVDILYKRTKFKLRSRLEYQTFNDILINNSFRLRIRPAWQFNIWDNCNPYIKSEFFINDDRNLSRNRFNLGITIKYPPVEFQPGYVLESNKKEVWSNRNIFWINIKFKF